MSASWPGVAGGAPGSTAAAPDAQQRLAALVHKACGRREADLDLRLVAEIKALCRQSEGNVEAVWEALWGQLRVPHAQSRLLALRLTGQLFQRSRAFRLALLGCLSQFLEAVLGFRPERPLPPPEQAAASLREEGLALLQEWSRVHGGRHKQLPMAIRYLKETLQYQFPDTAARSAAAEAAERAREELQRADLRLRLGALLAGEWSEGEAAARQLLIEVDECFALLEEAQQARQRARQQQAAAAGADLEWVDVAAEPAARQQEAREGLPGYAALEEQEGAEGAAALDRNGAGGPAAEPAEDAVVLETLAGLCRQLTNRTLPQMQDWLSVLGRVEPESPQEEQRRQRMLRAAAELRGRLAAAKARCESQALDLEFLLLQRQRRQQQQDGQAQADGQQQEGQQEGQQGGRGRPRDAAGPAAAEARIREVFGDSSSDGSEGEEEEAGAEGRRPGRGARDANTRQPPPGRRRRTSGGGSQADDDFESPYLRIVDPAAPRPRQPARDQQTQAGNGAQPRQQQQQGAVGSGDGSNGKSSLPEDLRRKLAAQAPTLPSSMHTMFWDSKTVPTFVSGHGLEVSNHWGPVDVHQELPRERFEEIFLLPMPANQQPRQQQQNKGKQPAVQQPAGKSHRPPPQRQQEGAAGSSGASPGRQAEQQQGGQQPRVGEELLASGSDAGPSTSSRQLPPDLQWPSRQAGGASALLGQPVFGAGLAGGLAPSTREAKRARRAEERAYNEAMIGGALSDELLARQLQDEEAAATAAQQQQDEQQGQQQGGGRGRRGRQRRQPGRQPPKKMGVRDRLAQKLLRGGALAAAVRDVATEESERRRDKFGNQWQ